MGGRPLSFGRCRRRRGRLPLLPLLLAGTAEPGAVRVAHEGVVDPGLVAHLMPAVVAPVAEDHLVAGRAVHARALLAERLLRRPHLTRLLRPPSATRRLGGGRVVR